MIGLVGLVFGNQANNLLLASCPAARLFAGSLRWTWVKLCSEFRGLLYPVQDFTTTMWVNGKEDTAVAVQVMGSICTQRMDACKLVRRKLHNDLSGIVPASPVISPRVQS